MAPASSNLVKEDADRMVYIPGPKQPKRKQVRFDLPSAFHTSDQPETTPAWSGSNLYTAEQRALDARREHELRMQHLASRPDHQFEQQVLEERLRLIETANNARFDLVAEDERKRVARENIKQQWVEQGIWDDKSIFFPCGMWKHEKQSNPNIQPMLDSGVVRVQKFDEIDLENSLEQMPQVRKGRECSRPYYQFIYQISKERERIQKELRVRGKDVTKDVNTLAYSNIRNIWRIRQIWDENWGTMPGISWKHEQPWATFLAHNRIQTNPVESDRFFTPLVQNHSPLPLTFDNYVRNEEDCISAPKLIQHKFDESNGLSFMDGFPTNNQSYNSFAAATENSEPARESLFGMKSTGPSRKPSIFTISAENKTEESHMDRPEDNDDVWLSDNESCTSQEHETTLLPVPMQRHNPNGIETFNMKQQQLIAAHEPKYPSCACDACEAKTAMINTEKAQPVQLSHVPERGIFETSALQFAPDINTDWNPDSNIGAQELESCHCRLGFPHSSQKPKAKSGNSLKSMAKPQGILKGRRAQKDVHKTIATRRNRTSGRKTIRRKV